MFIRITWRSAALCSLAMAPGVGCQQARGHPGPQQSLAGSAVASAPASVGATAPPASRPGCPADMVLVDGLFCTTPDQQCLEHHPEYLGNRSKSERCMRYAEPSRCKTEDRVLMRYCVDRYEWPNQRGERPRVLTTWLEARALCESVGKRLCAEPEWLFACEGEASLPYTYGYVRDPTKCVLDRMYVERKGSLARWERCQDSPRCLENFARLDQREPAGSFPDCVSPFGVFDMNGNVNEWVLLPQAQAPKRSGLKGGWWGPVRDRCRPTVRFHNEHDYGYEIGFRCCRDANP